MKFQAISMLSEVKARETLERIRWPNGPVCAHCGGIDRIRKFGGKSHRVGVYKCNDCGGQFTVTVNTIMADSHIPIRTWLMAFAIMCASKKGVSALQLKRQLGLGSYRSAWHMCHRIRHAMTQEPLAGLLGAAQQAVQVDETYIGGKPRRGVGQKGMGRGTKKQPVVALVESNGRARAFPIERPNKESLSKAIREHVDRSAAIHTDDWRAYRGVGKEFAGGHHIVKHSLGEYYRDGVTTNEVEAYFALLKRGIVGSFHSVSRKHLHRYCNEFSFRWDHRKMTDGERTVEAIKSVEGKRLKYRQPMGIN